MASFLIPLSIAALSLSVLAVNAPASSEVLYSEEDVLRACSELNSANENASISLVAEGECQTPTGNRRCAFHYLDNGSVFIVGDCLEYYGYEENVELPRSGSVLAYNAYSRELTYDGVVQPSSMNSSNLEGVSFGANSFVIENNNVDNAVTIDSYIIQKYGSDCQFVNESLLPVTVGRGVWGAPIRRRGIQILQEEGWVVDLRPR